MLRLSLRELLILVALVALAIASLKYASDTWLAIVAAVTMLAFFVALIGATVDRGTRQAFAIGFALTMAGYGLFVMSGATSSHNAENRNLELNQWTGRLPTTRLLRYVHVAVNDSKWIDLQTGKVIPNYDPNQAPANQAPAGGRFRTPRVSFQEFPQREFFMPIGHCWWALILGYLGGWFATFVFSRRINEQKSVPQ